MATFTFSSRGWMKLCKWELLGELTLEASPQEQGLGKGWAKGGDAPLPLYEDTQQHIGREGANTLYCHYLPHPRCHLPHSTTVQERANSLSLLPRSEAPSPAFLLEHSKRAQLPISTDLSNGLRATSTSAKPCSTQGFASESPRRPQLRHWTHSETLAQRSRTVLKVRLRLGTSPLWAGRGSTH